MKNEYDFSEAERGKLHVGDGRVRVPAPVRSPAWAGPEGHLGKLIVAETNKALASLRVQPPLVAEQPNEGHGLPGSEGTGRLLFDLVRNSADALRDGKNGKSILVRLVGDCLYCADDGRLTDEDAVVGLVSECHASGQTTHALAPSSPAFASVFRVSISPEFFSRSGSFRFGEVPANKRNLLGEPTSRAHRPAPRLPEPIDPLAAQAQDEELGELMSWATNIVRLRLRRGVLKSLAGWIRDFPPEFLLFAEHVRYLTLEHGASSRSFSLWNRQGALSLETDRGVTCWRSFKTSHRLSENAHVDDPAHAVRNKVPICWAAPLDEPSTSGMYWAAGMPTSTRGPFPGILNAPWKTSKDGQSLVDGHHNKELNEAAAKMIAHEFPRLYGHDYPAHLPPRKGRTGEPTLGR